MEHTTSPGPVRQPTGGRRAASAADASAPGPGALKMTPQKWGALACFALPLVYLAAGFIYLTGNLREALGPLSYDLADFLFGPVGAPVLVAAALAVKERIADRAPRRMGLALFAAVLAAAAFATVAFIRASNRHYHIAHPELNLEHSAAVLTVWATLVSGLLGAGWHFLGWALILTGSAGLSSRRLPPALSGYYLLVGVICLFVYLLHQGEPIVGPFILALGIWQGIVFWKTGSIAPD